MAAKKHDGNQNKEELSHRCGFELDFGELKFIKEVVGRRYVLPGYITVHTRLESRGNYNNK